ncbi:MAG: CapA family protein [Deltaproteobacteria bacterium]|nr:CapA family protein [Deltaproteobacteria bacterium]
MLILAYALAAEPALATPTPADVAYADAMMAVEAKQYDHALAAFGRCLALDAAHAGCLWESGWVYWVRRDWASVVSTWEKLDPAYPKLATNLAVARDQLALQRLAAEMRAKAATTYQSTAPQGASLRLRGVGDMMIGSAFPEGALPPDGGKDTFTAVRSLLVDADLTFGNLEGPLCDDPAPSDKCRPDGAPGSCYAFRTPAAYGAFYKDAGFDVVSTANNHAFDFGETCRVQTEATLDTLGIRWSGRPGTVARWTTGGLRVAMVGFHTADSGNNLNDLDTATTIVRGLAAESDIVIVSFHGGAEGSKALHVPPGPEQFYGENRGDLRLFTHAVIDAGADLVLGHGPHVLRGMEGYKGRLIAYSLGNFATYGRFNLSGNQGIGAILEVTLARDGAFAAGKILGTVQEGEGRPVPDAQARAADLVRVLSAEDFPGSGVQVAQDGSIRLP